jgi:hypothetical protein
MSSPGPSSMGQPSVGQSGIDPSNLGQPNPVMEEPDSSRRIIVIAVGAVLAIILIVAYAMRESPKAAKPASPYIASLSLSDFKMSAAENFIGSTVSYVDGTVANTSNKTVTHAVVEVVFKDDIGQLAQREELPLRVLKTSGAYPEAVDLDVSPLAPGQSKPFRLIFDSISAQWNHQAPEIRVTDVDAK